MANAAQQRYPEFNLRFKTDSSRNGPEAGKLARRYAGMRGDRAQVIFGSLDDLKRQPDASSTRRAWRRG
jgi:cytochrome c